MPSSNLNLGPVLAKVVSRGSITNFRRKQVIFSQGDRGHSVFYIDKGTVKFTVTSRRGKEVIIGVLGAGDFFGEDSLASQFPHLYSAIALTDTQVIKIEGRTMAGLLRTDPTTCYALLLCLLRRNQRNQQRLANALMNLSATRLAQTLVWLNEIGDGNIPKVSQQTLGEMIGATRQRVNFLMRRLKKLGVIEYAGGWIVHRSRLNAVRD